MSSDPTREPDPPAGPSSATPKKPGEIFDAPLSEGDTQITWDKSLGKAPPWRRFEGYHERRGQTYAMTRGEARMINAALHLRRPLLVTGDAGAGKSSLAYAAAYRLGLGPVLRWSITSRSTLQDGLYSYDPVARLQAAQFYKQNGNGSASDPPPISFFITLGPLGTAFYDSRDGGPDGAGRLRLLLVDEIDKGDLDLPNDLLHVLEEGEFRVNELVRDLRLRKEYIDKGGSADVDPKLRTVQRWDGEENALIDANGWVRCKSETFPLIIFTSNGERDFPPAFLRRCLQLEMPHQHDKGLALHLAEMVNLHFKDLLNELEAPDRDTFRARMEDLLKRFEQRMRPENLQLRTRLSKDQLLNAVYMSMLQVQLHDGEITADALLNELCKPLERRL